MAASKRLLLLAIFSLSVLQVTALISTSEFRAFLYPTQEYHAKCPTPGFGLFNRQICRSNKRFTICSRDFTCKNGRCVPKRPPPKNPCLFSDAVVCRTKSGLLCCAADQKCGKNQCIDKDPEPDTCEFGTTLCNNIDGASCCTDSQKCVNGICTSNSFCSPDTKTCLTSVGLLCCGLNQTCGENECLGSDPPEVCTPPETLCNNIDGSKCCSADQVCQAGLCVAK